MSRPPIEWPIPAYVAELRERVVLTFRAPRAILEPLVAGPLVPELAGGFGIMALALGSVRCVKPVGGVSVLASEFRTAELFVPARWRRACRPALRGSCLLRVLTDSPGAARWIRTALGLRAAVVPLRQGIVRGGYACAINAGGNCSLEVDLPRRSVEDRWPHDSAFTSHEAAEAFVLHPECHFAPDAREAVVHAVPVHEYARGTTHVLPAAVSIPLVARLLGCREADLALDHVFFQKRCTHTWSFPPDRIPASRRIPGLRGTLLKIERRSLNSQGALHQDRPDRPAPV